MRSSRCFYYIKMFPKVKYFFVLIKFRHVSVFHLFNFYVNSHLRAPSKFLAFFRNLCHFVTFLSIKAPPPTVYIFFPFFPFTWDYEA